MKLLILGGTSDTRRYIETCRDEFVVTVATEYGYDAFSADWPEQTLMIRFSQKSLEKFITENGIDKIIDTTHPFAKEITANALAASKKMNIPYEDHMRKVEKPESDNAVFFETFEEAADFLADDRFRSVLLTTGSNNVGEFSKIAGKSRVRVLPYEKSIAKCREAGFDYKNIIAMQGPFSEEFNEALMRETGADVLVTKMSGESGGMQEKIDACERLNVLCVIVTGDVGQG